MIKNYRISVDGQFYAGEKECELNTWRVDPWSNNSFHTKNQKRNILVFEPRENNNFKIITGVVNLIGEIRKIIEFINYTGLMQGNEIIIEAEPYKVPLELNIDYYLSLESELSKQKQINQEMKKQLDIATDLGQKRFEKLTKIEKENKELCHDKENLMSAYLGVWVCVSWVVGVFFCRVSLCRVVVGVCGGWVVVCFLVFVLVGGVGVLCVGPVVLGWCGCWLVCGWLCVRWVGVDRKSTRLNSSHSAKSRMPSSA